MRVAVFGAAGGVGRPAVRLAGERGWEVVAVARSVPTWTGADGDTAEWLAGDVRDPDVLGEAAHGADAVLWCVGVSRSSGGDLVADKEGEHAVLVASALDWTQVRPPRLTDGPGTGRYALTEVAPGLRSPAVSRADVAVAVLDLASGSGAAGPPQRWSAAAPFVVAAR